MKDDEGQEYYYTLLLLMVAGIVGIGLATDLLVLYLFFEMMSIPSYALVVFRRHEWMAVEAGMKYIVMGAVGSAFAFFGISLVYFQTGTLTFNSLIGMVIDHTDPAGSVTVPDHRFWGESSHCSLAHLAS